MLCVDGASGSRSVDPTTDSGGATNGAGDDTVLTGLYVPMLGVAIVASALFVPKPAPPLVIAADIDGVSEARRDRNSRFGSASSSPGRALNISLPGVVDSISQRPASSDESSLSPLRHTRQPTTATMKAIHKSVPQIMIIQYHHTRPAQTITSGSSAARGLGDNVVALPPEASSVVDSPDVLTLRDAAMLTNAKPSPPVARNSSALVEPLLDTSTVLDVTFTLVAVASDSRTTPESVMSTSRKVTVVMLTGALNASDSDALVAMERRRAGFAPTPPSLSATSTLDSPASTVSVTPHTVTDALSP